MGRLRAASLFLAALAVGLLLSACGGGGNGELLPGATADRINSNLDLVRESFDAGNCEKAETAVAEVSTQVDDLHQVDAKLKKALRNGAEKLSEVVSSCAAQEEAEEAKAEEAAEEEEQEQVEAEEAELAEEEALEEEQKEEEREQKAEEKAEKESEEEEPPTGGEESPNGEAKGHEQQEEETVEPPTEGSEELMPPGGSGHGGGIGPGASLEGGE